MKIITRTIYGSQLQTSKLMGIPHVFAPNTTLNEKFDIQSGVYPAAEQQSQPKKFGHGADRRYGDAGRWAL